MEAASSSSAASGKQEQTSVDAWIVQKLKNEWSSCDFGAMLTKEKLSDAVMSFRHLDTAIKRWCGDGIMNALVVMRREDVEESKFAIVEIIDAAENDSEEWVKVGAGIVKQYVFMSEDGSESGDTFFHEQIAKTTSKVLETVNSPPTKNATTDWGSEDFFCHENAFLNPSVCPEIPVAAVKHFTVVEASNGKKAVSHDEKSSERKPVLHRPQMPRPVLHPSSSSSSNAPVRLTPTTAKPPPPPKKNMTELSEIRRKADAGRFKRHRSRISMIDIDEVKQIESEKAQKAEERKKQKVVAKDKAATAGGSGHTADKSGAQGGGEVNGDDGNDELSQNASRSTIETYSQQDEEDEDDHEDHHRNHHDEDDDENDDIGSTIQHHRGGSDEERSEYIPDGTQALLNAAFHSTKDIMTEVVSQQQSLHSQHSQLQHQQHQYQQQHYEPEQQQHYHRGFEPEDATQHLPYGYGFNSTYVPQFADQSHAQQQQQQQQQQLHYQQQYHQQQQPPQQLHQYQHHQVQHQFGAGFIDDQSSQQQQQQQQQHFGQPRLPGFDGAQHNVNQNGNYMDGPPEYWR